MNIKKELLMKSRKQDACKVSYLIEHKNIKKISLSKCSKDTKLKSSSFDVMIG